VRVRNGSVGFLVLGLALSVVGSARAAGNGELRLEQGIRLDQLQPASPESPFVRALGPHEKGADTIEYAVGLTLDYGRGLVRAVSETQGLPSKTLTSPVQNALIGHVGGSFTPLHWLTIDLALPVALYVGGDIKGDSYDNFGLSVPSPSAQGIGDLRAGLHFRPIDRRSFTLALGGRFWAPMGSTGAFMSDQDWRAEVDVGVSGDSGAFRWGCLASVAPRLFLAHSGDRAALACAAQFRLVPGLFLGIEPTAMVFRQTPAYPATGPNSSRYVDFAVEPLASLRLSLGRVQLGVAAGAGFGGAAAIPGFRGLFTVAFVGGGRPETSAIGPSDRDLDDIPDKEDACPDQAGPDSKNPKERGCPSADKDADGVLDKDDACPDRPGVKHADPAANGCPDVDNDTLPEPIDECPVEPGAAPSGCPKYARMTGDAFVIKPPIKFKDNDARLMPEGQAALEEIAATMRANPKIEQVSISLGTKGARADLSDKRAQQIIFVLRAGSLDSNRYEVVLRDDLKAGTVEARLIK
jgi:outer membrane protein OmpA-like peptidoglycan-associated protein